MIGHFLITLTTVEEDRVLTGKMRPGAYQPHPLEQRGPCLVGTALNCYDSGEHRTLNYWPIGNLGGEAVERRYDLLCERFATARINAAIRNRILSNKARRQLARPTADVA